MLTLQSGRISMALTEMTHCSFKAYPGGADSQYPERDASTHHHAPIRERHLNGHKAETGGWSVVTF